MAPMYLWAVNFQGDASIGPITAPVDVNFSDVFNNLEAVFTVNFEGVHNNYENGSGLDRYEYDVTTWGQCLGLTSNGRFY